MKRFRKEKTMKRKIMAIGAVLACVCGVFGAAHEGVQLWENGPLWAKTNIGANSPTEAGYYFWWGDTLGYKWQNSNEWGGILWEVAVLAGIVTVLPSYRDFGVDACALDVLSVVLPRRETFCYKR